MSRTTPENAGLGQAAAPKTIPDQAGSDQTGLDQTDPARTSVPKAPNPALLPAFRVATVIVSVVAALVTAVLELALSSLRVGGVLVGLAVPVAIVANYAISWFAVETAGRRWVMGPPAVVWVVFMMVIAGRRTAEGDYLLSADNCVGLVLILAGSLSFAVYAYRMILRGPSVTKM